MFELFLILIVFSVVILTISFVGSPIYFFDIPSFLYVLILSFVIPLRYLVNGNKVEYLKKVRLVTLPVGILGTLTGLISYLSYKNDNIEFVPIAVSMITTMYSIIVFLVVSILLNKIDNKSEITLINEIKNNQETQINFINILSQREIEVIKLIFEGKTNEIISQELFISISGVKKIITSIYKKLDVANRKELLTRYELKDSVLYLLGQ
jgi:DNA-binding CsgD family transcriptional regulator